MTSRPGPGIRESLHHRGSGSAGPARPQVQRRPSQPVKHEHQPGSQDGHAAADDERATSEDRKGKMRVQLNTNARNAAAPENIHTSSDGARPVPKGKPQLFFANTASHVSDTAAQTTPFALPLPPRPGQGGVADGQQQQRLPPGGLGFNDIGAKPSNTDLHGAPPAFPGGQTADVFPWTGNHPEDLLSETLVRSGVSNKSQIMTETNNARNSLCLSLKNKTSMNALSLLFVTILEKRQACGRLTSAPGFKPPSRLTLRESARESWLHDLANPAVGLRRLSRTIPHGVTGTGLLDQCLNRSVPLPRAVWFAKCVGINEMRSHQRKGHASTISWVKGWTSSVQQFLDTSIATMGQDGWKPRITYALQLATSLYKEHLLEDDQFLDYILKNLDSCPQERLFLWLLVSSLYGQDLTASRRRGKRLGESLLRHAEKLYQLEHETRLSPLLDYLEKILVKLLVTSPSCLLLPGNWDAHIVVLRRLASRHPTPQIVRSVTDLDRRAKRLQQNRRSPSATQDATRKVISMLDSVDYTSGLNTETLACECLATISDARTLVSTVLKWASSLYREGAHRAYLATRLLRRWSRSGLDIDSAILSYFHSSDMNKGSDPRNVFRIVAELVRSKNFSVGKYLQWLIATGSVHQSPESSSSQWPLRLITEIPLSGLPEQVRNLRSTLLRGTPYCTEEEERCLDDAENLLRTQLAGLFGADMLDHVTSECDIARLHSTVKLELAFLLRHQIAATVETMDRVPTKDPSIQESGPVCTIAAPDFAIVRSYLEDFGDLSILADIIGLVATSLDSRVLTSASDTLLYHEMSFRAIGAFEPLFGKIAMRYAAIRTIRSPEREFLVSLADLCVAANAENHLFQAIAQDLSFCEQKNSIAACSPASDTAADVGPSRVNSDEDIERVLASGTTMDRQVMTRVFDKILANLEDQIQKGSTPSGNHSVWFCRLRAFDESAFENILDDRLTILLTNHRTTLSRAVLPALVTSRCVTLDHLLKIAKDCVSKRKAISEEDALAVSMDVIDALLPSEQLGQLCSPHEAYRYRLKQWKYLHDTGTSMLQLIAQTLELGAVTLPQNSQEQLNRLLTNERVHGVVRHFVLKDVQLLCSILGIGTRSYSDATQRSFRNMVEKLLDPSNELSLPQKNIEQQIKTVVQAADHLSLSFCQLEIRILFSVGAHDSERLPDNIPGAFLEALNSSAQSDGAPCLGLVSGLETDLATKICNHAERELLNAASFLGAPAAFDVGTLDENNKTLVQKYLTIIDSASLELAKDEQIQIISTLIERLKGMVEVLGKVYDPFKPVDAPGQPPAVSLLCPWLTALLRLAVKHGATQLLKIPSQHQVALLWSLKRLMTHPALSCYPFMAEFVFDVTIFLHDSISDDVRQHFTKLDAAKSRDDPRCVFLFGSTPPIDGWLALAKPITGSQPQGQNAEQNSCQETPSQPQTHNRASTANPNPLQRSLSQQHQHQLQAQHAQNTNRMYPQYPTNPQYPPQPQRPWSPYPQMPSAPGQAQSAQQFQQMQRMQQIQQNLAAQQRGMQPSPVQQQQMQQQQQHQRQMAGNPSGAAGMQAAKGGSTAGPASGAAKQEAPEMRTFPFTLKPWEIIPESGKFEAYETFLGMTLFGARKV